MIPLPRPPFAGGSLSVVIPAFNEERNLQRTLQTVTSYLNRTTFEILVVDDGSSDNTASITDGFDSPHVRLIQFRANRGKGAAVKAGVEASRHDWIVLCDADLATPIEDLNRLAAAATDVPIVIGSRSASGSQVTRSTKRRLAATAFNSTRRLLGLCRNIRDTQCGFKLIEGCHGRTLFAMVELDRFAFDIEFLELAFRCGMGIREVAVDWREASTSTVRPVRDGIVMIRDVLALRRRLVTRRVSITPDVDRLREEASGPRA